MAAARLHSTSPVTKHCRASSRSLSNTGAPADLIANLALANVFLRGPRFDMARITGERSRAVSDSRTTADDREKRSFEKHGSAAVSAMERSGTGSRKIGTVSLSNGVRITGERSVQSFRALQVES